MKPHANEIVLCRGHSIKLQKMGFKMSNMNMRLIWWLNKISQNTKSEHCIILYINNNLSKSVINSCQLR